jgi:IS30 family transposase
MSRHLRHHGKTRHRKGLIERRGKIQITHSIEERPQEAQSRSRLGDWERVCNFLWAARSRLIDVGGDWYRWRFS